MVRARGAQGLRGAGPRLVRNAHDVDRSAGGGAAAVRSREYQQWREANVVFYEESELTPAGLRKHMDELRATFLPILKQIDLSKDQ